MPSSAAAGRCWRTGVDSSPKALLGDTMELSIGSGDAPGDGDAAAAAGAAGLGVDAGAGGVGIASLADSPRRCGVESSVWVDTSAAASPAAVAGPSRASAGAYIRSVSVCHCDMASAADRNACCPCTCTRANRLMALRWDCFMTSAHRCGRHYTRRTTTEQRPPATLLCTLTLRLLHL